MQTDSSCQLDWGLCKQLQDNLKCDKIRIAYKKHHEDFTMEIIETKNLCKRMWQLFDQNFDVIQIIDNTIVLYRFNRNIDTKNRIKQFLDNTSTMNLLQMKDFKPLKREVLTELTVAQITYALN